ncbi:PTS lactose/cellobiose transporter subunit IIA [Spiroplasma tabanidicola]|uniref:PTS system, cellobiose-specific IIA component n=1 Tax=Spiroplasma tabanidicola TaxID=324079 RepID=A0A6I6CBS3_9MOLU|nr:PTS lactose/cellobiose transporter subunit IIA [Spiroplasma tabanidicola]QGS51658.1 PTS system, cellobiose-specific IIA component [Spiroplasma tabanidicola]
MATDLNWEEISMGIITYAGMAKTNAVLAIREAKEKNYDKASELIKEAHDNIVTAEKMHMDVITAECNGEKIEFKVLFMHAEDQMLTTQSMIVLAEEMIDMYKVINK